MNRSEDEHYFTATKNLSGNEFKNQHTRSEQLANRRIRVFISSTFRDMQRERELLVKTVFPKLRRICG